MTAHERFEELAAGYALVALEPDDEQAFLAHLPGCAACERALVDHLETLSHLAYDAPDAAPPPGVLEGIRGGMGVAPVASLERARSRRLSRTLVKRGSALTGVAAGVVLVLALIVSNVSLQHQGEQRSALSQRLGKVVAEMADGGAVPVRLAATGTRVEAVAMLKGDDLTLVVDGLPANDRSRSIYVLWERSRFGDVRAIGAFDVSSGLPDVFRGMRLDHRTAALASLVVTREQGRTAPTTTTQPALLAGELPVDRA